MHLFNVVDKSKERDHVITIVTWLDERPHFLKQKRRSSKTVKTFYIPLNCLLYLRNYLVSHYLVRTIWFAVDRDCSFTSLTVYIYTKKGYSVVFCIVYSEIYVDMTRF